MADTPGSHAHERAHDESGRPIGQPPPIVFVGGTGRSGTHVVAKLLSRHPRLAMIPVEVRFHVEERGFPGLLAGRVSKEQFVRRLRGFWWKGFQTSRMRGLYRFVPVERFERAVTSFEACFDDDPEAACRQLFYDLLWPWVGAVRRRRARRAELRHGGPGADPRPALPRGEVRPRGPGRARRVGLAGLPDQGPRLSPHAAPGPRLVGVADPHDRRGRAGDPGRAPAHDQPRRAAPARAHDEASGTSAASSACTPTSR